MKFATLMVLALAIAQTNPLVARQKMVLEALKETVNQANFAIPVVNALPSALNFHLVVRQEMGLEALKETVS
jgi:hypothetical protein